MEFLVTMTNYRMKKGGKLAKAYKDLGIASCTLKKGYTDFLPTLFEFENINELTAFIKQSAEISFGSSFDSEEVIIYPADKELREKHHNQDLFVLEIYNNDRE